MVQEVGERLSISLDLEVDGRMPLSAAHDLATTLERAIQADLDPTIEVDTHIEPLRVSPLAGATEDAEVSHQIAEALKTIATSVGPHRGRSQRPRPPHGGRARGELPLSRRTKPHGRQRPRPCGRARTAHPCGATDILRVIGHAEPLGHAPH
jgi:hypothetical protein